MSADDQAFLDVLNSVPRHIQRFSDDIANYVEAQVDKAAATLRESLSAAEWIPEAARPRPPPKPPAAPMAAIMPVGLYTRVQDWVLKNKILTGTFVIGFGASIYLVQRRKALYSKKRRAKRASNGARLEVVVIAGSISEPIVRSLALDLERRGFIVFVVCDDVQEELLVQNEARTDIRPLMVDVSEPHISSNSVERFAQYLSTPQHAFEGARAHHLQFTSLIVIPSLTYPSAPIATISPTHISDLLNTRLLHPILITQAFLPLLTSPPTHHHHHPHPPPPAPKVLLLTPAIIPSLNPPFHAPESTISAALTAFTASLSSELRPLGVPVTHFQLGAFDTSSLHPKNQLATLSGHSAETRAWAYGAREAYGKNFIRAAGSSLAGADKGSNLRELHNAVFDEMAKTGRRAGGTVRVGQGASLYSLVGAWAPRGLVGWMMGVRRVERVGEWSQSSNGGSEAGVEGSGESEYISVNPGVDVKK